MGISTPSSFAGEGIVPLWQERRSMFVQPAIDYRVGRRRIYRSHRHSSRSEPRSPAKRFFDVIGAGLGILFFAPAFIAIAIAIKLTSPGPVFFSQPRYGYRNRRFRIYKFRTMYTHLADGTGVHQTTRGDPRITAVGRILRHTSLDELPQLLNVMKGDMSLVGPRPHVPGMLAGDFLYEELVPYYFQRHAVRPGITGLAQVSGCRGSTSDGKIAIARIDYDLDYIATASLWLDAKIILRTVAREFLWGNGV
jgi:polysaccharide biosynthesis protein PslA